MADAPERIWATVELRQQDTGRWGRHPTVNAANVGYVRADLAAAMEAENQRLREALEASVAFSDGIADQCGIDMDETAFVIRVMPEGREIVHRSWADVQTSARSALRSTREGG